MGSKRDSPFLGQIRKISQEPDERQDTRVVGRSSESCREGGIPLRLARRSVLRILRVCDNRISRMLADTAMSSAVIRVIGRSYLTGGSPWDLGEVLIHELYDQLASLNENLAIVVIEFGV